MKVDLHIHTYFSDGTLSPTEVVQKAKLNGVGMLAITDHNRLDSWEEFEEVAKEEGLVPIRGVEINAKYKDRIFHLLAYGFELTEELVGLINHADAEMQRMSAELIEKLANSYAHVTVEDYEEYAYDRRKGGWKGIHYLLDRGLSEKLFEGFRYYKNYGCDFVFYDFPQLGQLCEAIKNAGGYSVLAHPGNYYGQLSHQSLVEQLEGLRLEGIDGVECYYPTHSELFAEVCANFCIEHDMIITSGSDEHGDFNQHAKIKDHSIGCLQMDEERLAVECLKK